MTRRKIPENKRPQPRQGGQKSRDPIPWRYCLLTLGCGAILVAGFFFAARQHFSSIDFGIKNSRLRQQIENLEADKRRFILAKEIALSPAEIKKAAQKLGFREISASSDEVYQQAKDVKEKPKMTQPEKPKQIISSDIEEPKKEDKKTSKEVKKVENKFSEVKEKSKPQIARK